MALKSPELLKLGVSITESPQASSTGVAAAKDALVWHSSQQQSQPQQSQSQSQSQSSQQPQLLQPQLLQLLQPQALQPLHPQLLQSQPLQGSQQVQQGLTGPQGPVKKGKFRFAQLPQRLNGPEMLRSTPKQLQLPRAVAQVLQALHPQPLRVVPQPLQAQLLQPLQVLQPVRTVAQPQPLQVLQPHPQPVLRTLAQPQPEAQDRIFATGIVSFL